MQNQAPKCVYCKGSHYGDQCEKFPTVDARKRQLRGHCFNCLQEGHVVSECDSPKSCYHCKKERNHHSSLCFVKFGTKRNNEWVNVATEHEPEYAEYVKSKGPGCDQASSGGKGGKESALLATGELVVLQTAKAIAQNSNDPNFGTETALLFDCAANRSYATEALAKQLKLKTRKEPELSVKRFATDKAITMPTKLAELLCFDNGTIFEMTVTIIPMITGQLTRSPVKLAEVKRLANQLKLADDFPSQAETRSVGLLIGNDYYSDIVTGERFRASDGLYFLGSHLGWILTGRLPNVSRGADAVSMCCFASFAGSIDELNSGSLAGRDLGVKPQMDDMWSLESIGITESPWDSDDAAALAKFENTIKMEGSRYMVTFPWKDQSHDLPNNYNLSLKRLYSTVKKLNRSPELLSQYSEIIEDQRKKGIIELVDANSTLGSRYHYIPHHPVVTPTKTTTKVRIVYDGSAKANKWSPSLNECLHRGPLLLQNMCGLLLRFRTFRVALTSDIEKAFLQVGLQDCERDVTRFLWLKNPNEPISTDNLNVYRFCRVPFGVNSSPFLLNGTVQHHTRKYDTDTARQLARDKYSDNAITGVDSDSRAIAFYHESKQIFREASMNLREWCSNSPHVMKCVPEIDRAKPGVQKVLGIPWDPTTDQLAISIEHNKLQGVFTKRDLMSAVAGVFDPLGFMLPVTIRGKILLQGVCQKRSGWDAPLSTFDMDMWRGIAQEYQKLEDIKIPRFIGSADALSIDLLCFCDASENSYAATVYLRLKHHITTCNLVFAKSRLNPVRKLTIPRLELLALWIGTNAVEFVKEHLAIPSITLWSDSQVVLGWLKSTKPLGRFVENRIKKIRRLENAVFRYISTNDNPADLATRGISASNISSLWWHGPKWVISPKSNWPTWNIPEIDPGTLIEKSSGPIHEMSAIGPANVLNPYPFEINIERFSSLTKVLRITAWWNKFITKSQATSRREVPSKCLSVNDIEKAKNLWLHFVQSSHYEDFILAVRNGKRHDMIGLRLFLDNQGLLRCSSRLGNADMDYAAKYPILMPTKHRYTHLMIANVHERFGHAGVSHTLNLLRQEYWVPKGRSAVKKVLKKCIWCQKVQGRPYPLPQLPELPRSRVVPRPPFQYTGVDYFGPLTVKTEVGHKKVWVCLFTCLSVRAVHLEVVDDMTLAEFIGSLRRFIARRGKPLSILSDNAPQFKAAKSLMDEVWSDVQTSREVFNYCANHHSVKWSFIPEFAPWQGGVYERMIGIVKQSLRKAFGRTLLTSSQLSTMLCEVEALVNSRPLTYVGDDFESSVLLTPGHFLSLNPQTGIPCVESDNDASDPDYVPKNTTTTDQLYAWKKGQNLLTEYWKVWMSEYLNSLRERSTYDHPRRINCHFSPSVGHVVS